MISKIYSDIFQYFMHLHNSEALRFGAARLELKLEMYILPN